jgi:hypothetical protein
VRKAPVIIPSLYLLAVLGCIPLAFDYAGDVDMTWLLVLIVLTLPWSVVSVVFMWALIHGAGLEFFTFMYLAFAAVNVYGLYRLCSAPRGRAGNDAA